MKRTRLQKSGEVKQNENDEDFNLNISHETALKHTTKRLYNFVAGLVTDEGPEVNESKRCVFVNITRHEKILNLCQDITAIVIKMPIPKHINIALHVLKKTRSKT